MPTSPSSVRTLMKTRFRQLVPITSGSTAVIFMMTPRSGFSTAGEIKNPYPRGCGALENETRNLSEKRREDNGEARHGREPPRSAAPIDTSASPSQQEIGRAHV